MNPLPDQTGGLDKRKPVGINSIGAIIVVFGALGPAVGSVVAAATIGNLDGLFFALILGFIIGAVPAICAGIAVALLSRQCSQATFLHLALTSMTVGIIAAPLSFLKVAPGHSWDRRADRCCAT